MAEPTDDVSPSTRRIVLLAAILASSMGFIDGSVVSIAIPSLRADLGASLGDAQWINNAYLLLLSALILVGGAAGDRFGLRRTFGMGIAVFVLASLACALAPTPQFLIGARAVQGFGAAFMVPGSLAIIARFYPREERGRAIGIWAAASSFTTLGGPVLGGAVLTWFGDWGWRLVFAINLPLGIVALLLLWLRVPSDRPEGGRLDVLGAVLATLSLGAVAFGLTGQQGDGVPPRSHIALWGCAGLVLGAAFVLWERRAPQPMLPLRLFADRRFSGANALTFMLYFALGGVSFFLPMTLIGGWGEDPSTVALVLLPMGAILTALSTFSGTWADRFGAGPPIALGSVIVAVAFLLLGLTAPLHQPWLAVAPAMALLGVGMGLVVSPLSTAVMTSVADADTGIASGVNNAVARVAGLVAVAGLGAVVAVVFEQALGPAAELGVFFGLPARGLDPETELRRVAATDAAFAALTYVTAALSLVAAVIAWATLERRPTGSPPGPQPARGP
jgi:EmrB/QacA subfamily drug resistance transporter